VKKYVKNKYFRIVIYLATFLVVIYLLLSWLLKYHTKELIEKLVAKEANGKLDVKIGKASIKLFPVTRLDLSHTELKFFDETGKNVAYKVKFTYLGMQLHSLTDFVFGKKLQVDFLVAEDPHVEINPEYKKKQAEGNNAVHFEIGNIYLALQKIARSMQVKRFGLLNGKMTLLNMGPNKTTISLGGVNFTAKDLAMKTGSALVEEGLLAGRIRVNTGNQSLTFPEGNFSIKYGSLHLDTEEKLITLDSFRLDGHPKDTSYGEVHAGFSRFKIYNLDFWTLYNQHTLKVDSIICQDPVVNMKIDVTPKPGEKTVSDIPLEKKLAGSIGKLKIEYLSLRNCDINITTKNKNKYVPFQSVGNNFEAKHIYIDSAQKTPLDIGQVSFAIKNYHAATPDSLYNIYFDSVLYQSKSLFLKNLRLEPSPLNKKKDLKWLTIPGFELRNISITNLLSEKKLKAKEVILRDAIAVNYYYPKQSSATVKPTPFRELIHQINHKIDLQTFRIQNGSILNQSVTDPNQKATVVGLNSVISLQQMFDASTYELMGYAVGSVSFDSILIKNDKVMVSLSNGEINGPQKTIKAESILFKSRLSNIDVTARNIEIQDYHFDDAFHNVRVENISYSSAKIQITGQQKQSPSHKTPVRENNLLFTHINTKNTEIVYTSGDSIKVKADMKTMDIDGFSIDQKNQIGIKKFSAEGNGIAFLSPGTEATTGPFHIIEESNSSIKNIKFDLKKNGDTVRSSIPILTFKPAIARTLANKYPVISEVFISDPVIYAAIHAKGKSSANPSSKAPISLDMDGLTITQARLSMKQSNGSKSLKVSATDLNIILKTVHKEMNATAFGIASAKVDAGSFDLQVNDSIRVFKNEGKFKLDLADLNIGRGVDSGRFHAVLNTLEAEKLNLHMLPKKGNNPIEVNEFSLGGEHVTIDSLDKAHILERLRNSPSVYAGNINFRKKDEKSDIAALGIRVSNGGKLVTIDSFHYQPVIDRDSFNRTQQFQKDYFQASTKKIIIRDFDAERMISDSSYVIQGIEIDQADLKIYKDKRLPFQHGIIKPLPVDMLKKINKRFHLDSLRLNNASVVYEEFNDKTNSLGKVNITHIQALIRNAKNYDLGPTDSLYLMAYARLLDTVNTRVHFDESYLDTLSAFYFSVRVGKISLPLLNQFVVPMANAKIISGELDTLQIRAVGREYLAHGKMNMYYRDLKVQFLNKADQSKTTVITKFITWVANGLVRDSNKKTGMVFAERLRERAVFNYWIKIILGGTLTNAGIRSNTKSEKKYKKSLKKANVPEIPEVQL
jgi:hypothetical protein